MSISVLISILGCQAEQQATGSTSARVSAPSAKRIEGGAPAGQIVLSTLDGVEKRLEDFRGKIILINFWATWCVPCVAEMPLLEKLYKKYRDKGFEVIAITADSEPSLAKQFAEHKGLSFTILHDPEMKYPRQFGVEGFPESFFIDAQGRFVELTDPETQTKVVRLISDRPWDTSPYFELVEKLLSTGSRSD